MTLHWGIIGTGNIASTFATALNVSKSGKLVAVASRKIESAQAFGAKFGVTQCYVMEDLFADTSVDIVYIATPHPQHCTLAVNAANAKKHILVEKPAAMNEAELTLILDAVRRNNVFFMEAYMYRCHPQTLKLLDMISKDTSIIGSIKLVRASFAFDGLPLGPTSRLWRNELGGGAILDIGGYPMSFALLVARVVGKKEPMTIKGIGHIGENRVDEWAMASIGFGPSKELGAQIFTSVVADHDGSVEILGSTGSIRVRHLWRPDLGSAQIEVKQNNSDNVQIIPVESSQANLFAIEADAVAHAIMSGKKECQHMTWEDSVEQVRAMDQWRKDIGLVFAADSVE